MSYTCPPDHPHEAKQSCYAIHGCRCAPCKARRKVDARRWSEQERERRRSTPKCGTLAGYSQHRREGTKPCDLCRAANNGYQHGRKVTTREQYRDRPTLALAPATLRDVLGALDHRIEALALRSTVAGINAPTLRERVTRLRAAADAIAALNGDPA